MVTVSILGIGIVLISRSFLSTLSVLDSMQNRVSALYLLSARMSALEEDTLGDDSLKTGETQEETALGNRQATFKSEIVPLDIEGFSDYVNEVRLSLFWSEGHKSKDEILVAYLPSKVKE